MSSAKTRGSFQFFDRFLEPKIPITIDPTKTTAEHPHKSKDSLFISVHDQAGSGSCKLDSA
jgi:hypothetical protein